MYPTQHKAQDLPCKILGLKVKFWPNGGHFKFFFKILKITENQIIEIGVTVMKRSIKFSKLVHLAHLRGYIEDKYCPVSYM